MPAIIKPGDYELSLTLRDRLTPTGVLVLECGVVMEGATRAWRTYSRWDGVKRYPTLELLMRDLLVDYAVRPTGPSVDQAKADAYAAMTVAIACSGTVTTELAAQGAAVVTGYKLGWITWALLRFFLFKSRFSALVNVAVNREVIPEFLQTSFSVKNIEQAAELRLSDPAVLKAQQEGQREALRIMAGTGRPAAEIAAETILKLS